MQITEVTRRNIIDVIRTNGVRWHGRLDEPQFLSRVVDLNRLPSTDSRFRTMADDLHQHRIGNLDWDDDWVFEDSRLNLLKCEDDLFLRFLCETIHPVVRTNAAEIRQLIELYNGYLSDDNYEIYESKQVSRRPVFAARVITAPIVMASEQAITAEFVREQLRKCDTKLAEGDDEGAITSSRSLVEGVLGEIHLRGTGKQLPSTGDLLADYKRVKDLLNLSQDQHIHEGLKGLIRSFNGVIQNIDFLSNKLGDRHRPVLKPERHHAKLVVDSAKTLVDFLYSTLEAQANRTVAVVDRLLSILDSDARFFDREDLLATTQIIEVLRGTDVYLRRLAKDELIKKYPIDSYRASDIFFAAMRIFTDDLDVDDVVHLHIEGHRNSQAIGWPLYEKELEARRPDLLGRARDQIYGRQDGP